jgi:hypothetical protein
MEKVIMRVMAVSAVVVAMLAFAAGPASAHEERDVGKYTFAVGFGQEPAYAGQPNSVQMFLSQNGKPVNDLGDTLSVTVGFGDQTVDLSIVPDFEIGESGTPGDYRAWFIPTRAGHYTFHFTGSIGGQKVHETFTSGPKTFDDVVSPTDAEFPIADPTNGELADRITREIPRIDSAIAGVKSSAQSSVASVSDDAKSAKTLGLIGIVVGGLGLIAGISGVAMVRRRRA